VSVEDPPRQIPVPSIEELGMSTEVEPFEVARSEGGYFDSRESKQARSDSLDWYSSPVFQSVKPVVREADPVPFIRGS
jgi:hypothetical protein